MGFNPEKKNSTAITISIKPIILIITFIPVSPINLTNLAPPNKVNNIIRQTTNITKIKIPFLSQPFALSIINIELVMAPGPQIIGIPSGVIEISSPSFFISFLVILSLEIRAPSISKPIIKKRIPPATLNPLAVIWKKSKINFPVKAKNTIAIKAVITARLAVTVLLCLSKLAVIDKNTGKVLMGLIMVIKAVKHSKAKEK